MTTQTGREDQVLSAAVALDPKREEAEPARASPLPEARRLAVARAAAAAAPAAAAPGVAAAAVSSAREDLADDAQSQAGVRSVSEDAVRTDTAREERVAEGGRRTSERRNDSFVTTDSLFSDAALPGESGSTAVSSKRSHPVREELQSDVPRSFTPGDTVAPESPAATLLPLVRVLASHAGGEDESNESYTASNGQPGRREAAGPRAAASRLDLRKSETRSELYAEQEMTVEISIGRIDIRAAAPPQSTQKRAASSPDKSSLDLYLEKQRAGGRA